MNAQQSTTNTISRAMLRALYLALRIYCGLVVHFGWMAAAFALLTAVLVPDLVWKAIGVLLVPVAHFYAVRALDAGYIRLDKAILRRQVAKPSPAAVKKPAAVAANHVGPDRPAALRLATPSMGNFRHFNA